MRTCKGGQGRIKLQVLDPQLLAFAGRLSAQMLWSQTRLQKMFCTPLKSVLPEWAPLCCRTLTPKCSSHQPVWWGTRRAFQRPEGGRLLAASPAGIPVRSAADWRLGGKLPVCVFWPLSPCSIHRHTTVLRRKTYQHQPLAIVMHLLCSKGE